MNIKDIARMAGVSVSTVSKVMNGKDKSISSATRDRVLSLAKEYHYIPYASVKAANPKTFSIGVLLRDARHNDMTLRGFINKARTAGYNILVSESYDDPQEEIRVISSFCNSPVDAVLWEQISSEDHNEASSQLYNSKIPYIIYNSSDEASVSIDYAAYGYSSVQTLIDHGHRDIIYISADTRESEQMLSGVRQCMLDNRIEFGNSSIYNDINESLLYKINTHTVSGIVCFEYLQAISIYELLQTLHYRVPFDFSLIATRDDSYPVYSYPAISAYTIPRYTFGQYLCGQVISMIESGDADIANFDVVSPLKSTSTIDIPYNQRQRKILVLGSINTDHYLNVSELPTIGRTITTSSSSTYSGGKGINVAVGLSKLSQPVALIGSVGDDLNSDTIFSCLKEFQIDDSGVSRYSNVQTGKAYITVDTEGRSMISILSGANSLTSAENVYDMKDMFESCGYVLIDTEVPMEAVRAACSLAHQHQAKTIVKPSSCGKMDDDILSQIDILVPNYDELSELCPGPINVSDKASMLIDHGVSTVIVTLGANGCMLKTAGLEKIFNAADFRAIDTTGACDAFISALTCYMQRGYDIESAIRIATYAAGFCVAREGVVPSLVDKNTLESYIHMHERDLL